MSSIKLLSGDVDSILKNHSVSTLINFTDSAGNALSPLGKRLFNKYPEYEDIIKQIYSVDDGKPVEGDFAYKVMSNDERLVAAFITRLDEADKGEEEGNPTLYRMLTNINKMMVEAGDTSVMLSYYGKGTGYNFSDFLSLMDRTFDPSITVYITTTDRLARFCQLPHWNYPCEGNNESTDSDDWVMVRTEV